MNLHRHLSEPPDGSMLVLHGGGDSYKVIWRDDARATDRGAYHGQHWFANNTIDLLPQTWEEVTRQARAAYAVADRPHTVAGDED